MFGVWDKIMIPLRWNTLLSLTGLSFRCLRPNRAGKVKDPDNFINDERYTVEYIRREARILIRFLRPKKHKGVGAPFTPITELDGRILRRWGLR